MTTRHRVLETPDVTMIELRGPPHAHRLLASLVGAVIVRSFARPIPARRLGLRLFRLTLDGRDVDGEGRAR